MNESIIIALRGRGSSGKTTTIRELHLLLIGAGFRLIESTIGTPGPDFRSVFDRNGILIGVSSKGDTYDDVKGDLDWLIARSCTLLLCACRTKDNPNRQGRVRGSNTAINGYTEFNINRINKTVSMNPQNDAENEANNAVDAQRLLAELLNSRPLKAMQQTDIQHVNVIFPCPYLQDSLS